MPTTPKKNTRDSWDIDTDIEDTKGKRIGGGQREGVQIRIEQKEIPVALGK